MARRINPFIYEPTKNLSRAKSKGEKSYIKYLRSCGQTFISRQEVREFVFSKDNYKCVECDTSENLQVDHIVSIYRVFKDGIDIREINNIDNLQTLCGSCNSRKKP